MGFCDRPGSVGPGSGDLVSTLVDYDPWSLALVTMAPSAAAEVGDTVTMDSHVTAAGVYGMQLHVRFDPTKLEFQAPASSHHDVDSAGWYWGTPLEDFVRLQPRPEAGDCPARCWDRSTPTPRP